MTTAKRKLAEFIPDDRNANKHTLRGTAMLEDSLRQHGAGRSILVDRNNRVIAGNATLETAVDIGLQDAVVVPTDGKQLVVVQRVDIDLDTPQGRALAIADNRTADVSIDWDADVLASLQDEIDLGQYFNENELDRILNPDAPNDFDPADEWRGMPEFEHDDLTAFQSIRVHFPNAEAVQSFASLIGQSISDKTRALWYPKQAIRRYGEAHES